jgi:Domain of unknown function (DUF5666)
MIRLTAWMAFAGLASVVCHANSIPLAQAASRAVTEKQVGTIEAISGNSITLSTDTGASVNVQVEDTTRMVRVAPGQTDLKGATAIHLLDLQTGDRILVRGKPSEDTKSIVAAVIIAMKGSDVQAKQEQERQDWQKRGIGGLVSAVDPASGTITISFTAAGTKKPVAIHTTSSTVFRRYAPDSVKFDDAQPSSIGEIKPGDQLRARGNRSADNTEFAAEEIVSGAFENIAGTIASIDTGANTLTVKDLISKRNVTVKIAAESEVRKLPQQMAQMIAMRLKGVGPSGAPNGSAGGSAQQRPASANVATGGRSGGTAGRGGGAPDFQQILSRMPPAGLSDLRRGDAVMIVSTEGSNSAAVTAITLLAGVEPILQASPGMTLSPWSLGGSLGGDDTGSASPQ